jgi:hypothetical protein
MNKVSTHRQHDLFDESEHRWISFSSSCREEVVMLLTQLLIQSIQMRTVIDKSEGSHVSESTAVSLE